MRLWWWYRSGESWVFGGDVKPLEDVVMIFRCIFFSALLIDAKCCCKSLSTFGGLEGGDRSLVQQR